MRKITTQLTARHAERPIRGRAIPAFGAIGMIAVSAVAAAGPAEATSLRQALPRPAVHVFNSTLRDLQPNSPDLLDGAAGKVVMITRRGSATLILAITGARAGAAGHTYGAHLHTGPCLAGNGAAAGPHYNQSTLDGVVPPVVSDQTEVWLDVTIQHGGGALAVARVPFVPTPGNRSVVLHAESTDDHGTAGARLACLPVSWS